MRSIRSAMAILLLVAGACANGQAPPAQVDSGIGTQLKAADLQVDVAVLRHAYEALHPGLYRYNTKAEMDVAFEKLGARLNHDQSLASAYLALSEFAAQIKCGHTYANFYNQSKAVAQELFEGHNRVPFYFIWYGEQMVVTRDFTSEHRLPRGTVVESINGTPAAEILHRLMGIARADGSNDAKRKALLAVTGDDLYETFDIFFPLYFQQVEAEMKLAIREPEARSARTIAVSPLSYAERIAPIKAREAARKGGSEALFTLKFLTGGAAYLQMPTWQMYDSKWDWQTWLNARLDEVAEKKSPALIIDLRGNEGGNDVGNLILARLTRKDLALASTRRLVRYRKVPDDLAEYLDTWDPSFKDWGQAAVELSEPWPTAPPVNYFKLTRYDDDKEGDVIKPSKKPFDGKVFVLVDSSNSSATFQFAQAIQQNNLGVLVGQPTGGNQRGINGGAFFFLKLPKSKIEMDLPVIGSFPVVAKPDAGLVPEREIPPTIAALVAGKDSVLQAVEREIKKQQ